MGSLIFLYLLIIQLTPDSLLKESRQISNLFKKHNSAHLIIALADIYRLSLSTIVLHWLQLTQYNEIMANSQSISQAQALRKTIRHRRQSLSKEQQLAASTALSIQLLKNVPDNIKRVAIYLASDGEIDPQLFIEGCWQRDIDVYLPVLHPFSRGNLLFLRYDKQTKMSVNKYGISEPALNVSLVLPARKLDIIYTPLVAFDAQGNRMGMGGGYYDRTLAANPHVVTVGIAHDCQQVDELTVQPWDIALQRIITPTQNIVA